MLMCYSSLWEFGDKRMAYKMQPVKTAFTGPHPTNPRLTAAIPRLNLACGHTVDDLEALHYLNQASVAIRRAGREMLGEVRKVRCYECGKVA